MPRRAIQRAVWATRRTLAAIATRRLATRYFTGEELEHASVEGRTLQVADATFRVMLGVSGPRFRLTKAPDDEWLRGHLADLDEDSRVWEAVAFVKVRRLATAADIVARARTGELYDESYFTRRGGGAPYVGYPASVMLDESSWWEEVADEIVERFHPGSALDVGCATGLLVRALQERGVSAAGIDVSEWAIDHRVTDAAIRGSATELPWPSASFDLIVSQDFMEHIHPDDLPRVLAEQVRVTRPGGTILHLIPFYPFDPPIQVDAHLCQASRAWWTRLLAGVEGASIAREPDEGAERHLDRYYELRTASPARAM